MNPLSAFRPSLRRRSALLASMVAGLFLTSVAQAELVYRIPLARAAVGAGGGGALQAEPSSLAFGDVPYGLQSTSTVVLTNTGVASMPLGTTSVSGAGFSRGATTCGTFLAPSAQCNIAVSFAPTGSQAFLGSLVIPADGGGADLSVALSGTGVSGTLALSSPSLSFNVPTQVGQDAPYQQLTLTNNGSAPVGDIAISASNEALFPAFTQNNNCLDAVQLLPGLSCQITVGFRPSRVAPAHSGNIFVMSDADNGLQQTSLSGSGVAPSASLISAVFGDVAAGSTATAAVVLRNTGVGPVAVTIPATVSGSEFSYQDTNCPATLAAGAQCNINVTYSPVGTTTSTGTVSVTTDAGVSTAGLSGRSLQAVLGVSATSRAFGNVQAGQSATSVVHTLTNSGNITATGLAFAPPEGFGLSSNGCGATLAASANCTFAITFSPAAAQPYEGNLSVTSSNAGPVPVALSGTGVEQVATLSNVSFGNRATGSTTDLTATLANTGFGPLSVTVPVAGSVTGSGFSFVSTTCGTSVPSGQECDVTVRLTASGTTAHTGVLTVATGAGDRTATLSGQSQQAVLAVSATSRAFGNVQVGQSTTSAVHTLTNSGNIPATGLVLTPPTGYSVTANECGATLAANANCTFAITFSPTAVQSYPGNLTIASTNATTALVALTGAGVSQSATLSNTAFGNRASGSTTDLTATLVNTGSGPLSVTVPGAGSVSGTGFSFVSTTCSTSVPSGQDCTVTVRLTASGTTAHSGSLSVTTGAGVRTATLSGQSQQAILSVNLSSGAFGDWTINQTVSSSVLTLTNSGNISAAGLTFTPPTGYSVTLLDCGTTLAANAGCSFRINFSPTAVQSYAGNVTIAATNAGSATVAVTGAGIPAFFVFNGTVSNGSSNYNLRAAAVAAGWNQTTPLNATVTLANNVVLGALSTGNYAFDTGASFPQSTTLTLNIGSGAYIVGAGGAGGAAAPGVPGAGGPAFRAQYAIQVNNSGIIAGGGGGGAGSVTTGQSNVSAGGAGGGGGMGFITSAGGARAANFYGAQYPQASNGTSGNFNLPGIGGAGVSSGSYPNQYSAPFLATSGRGGNGGAFGQPGNSSAAGSGGGAQAMPGGAAGSAVTGNSFVNGGAGMSGSVVGPVN